MMTVPLDKSVICPVLIGRTRELAALNSLIDVARSGQGHTALISGEAGIGKSRLVAEAKSAVLAQGYLLLQGHVSRRIPHTRTLHCSTSSELFLQVALLPRLRLTRNY